MPAVWMKIAKKSEYKKIKGKITVVHAPNRLADRLFFASKRTVLNIYIKFQVKTC